MSQSSKNIFLSMAGLGVAGALAAYAYFGVMKDEESKAEQKDIDDRVFQAAATAKKGDAGTADVVFQRLEVQAKGDTTILERKDGQWFVSGASPQPADRIAVDALTSQLQTAKFKTKLEEKPTDEDLTKYGLKSPRFVVVGTAKMPDGSEKTLKLFGGIDNPFDGSVYMRRDEDPAVYTAEGGLRWSLEKSTFDLREKEVFNFEEPKLTRLEVKSGGQEYLLERDAKNAWQLKKPVEMPADGTAVQLMLASLKAERAQQFIPDSPHNRTRLGLEKPAVDAKLTVKTATGGTEDVRVRVSHAEGDAGGGTYGLIERPASGVFAEVGSGALSALNKSVDELKDKTLLKFDSNQVAKISVSPGGGGPVVVVERGHNDDGGLNDRWEVTAPQKGPAKAFKVSAMMWSLSSTKATAFGEENPKDWKKFGVDEKTSMWVKLEDASGKVLASFVRGNEVPNKPGTVYVRGTKNQVAEIEAARFAEFPVVAAEYLEAAPVVDGGVAAQGN